MGKLAISESYGKAGNLSIRQLSLFISSFDAGSHLWADEYSVSPSKLTVLGRFQIVKIK